MHQHKYLYGVAAQKSILSAKKEVLPYGKHFLSLSLTRGGSFPLHQATSYFDLSHRDCRYFIFLTCEQSTDNLIGLHTAGTLDNHNVPGL